MTTSRAIEKHILTEVVDWGIDADKDVRPGSIDLQRVVHKEWHDKIKSRSQNQWLKAKPLWRVRAIEKLEVRLGGPIFGEVLEIGAGTALCSTFAAKRETVQRVTAMDYDPFCVEEMMITIFDKFDAPVEKIRRAYGSYNHIPEKSAFDFIIGVGALHHAENLRKAFAELYSALKPGGVILVSDVCEFDSVSNGELAERYELVDPSSAQRYGREVRVKENGDHWYRLSEWISAGRDAGFEVLSFLFDVKTGEPADDHIFAKPELWSGYRIRVFQPYFSDRGYCDSLIMILQKPNLDGTTPCIPRQGTVQEGPVAFVGSIENEELRRHLKAAEAKILEYKARTQSLKESLARTAEKLAAARNTAIHRAPARWLKRLFG